MEMICIEDIKRIQIDILKAFASYCDRKGLKYYLAYGTLIGAIRHQGYIPWDDDIDVIMPRPDYELFVSRFNDSRYKIFCSSNSNNCPFSYAKLYDDRTLIKERTDIKYSIGLNIDIFVLDGIPENSSLAHKHIKNCSFWLNIIEVKKISLSKTRSLIRNTILLFLKILVLPFPFVKCMKRVVKLNKKYPYDSNVYCSDLCYTGALCLNKSIFGEGIQGLFEGCYYRIPFGYDQWLRSVYGDYMQLPPKEKRITHHDFVAYWK